MSKPTDTKSKKALVKSLMKQHGTTFSEELKIDLAKQTPSPLFQWLCAAILFSARISNEIAAKAALSLRKSGWTTARKMADSTWAQRTRVLNKSGYARYDERTSRMLGDMSHWLLEEYSGDLRNLREAAHRDPDQERQLLKKAKGLGDVGADIFLRELQHLWREHYPLADKKALSAAKRLGLGTSTEDLASLVNPNEFPRLLVALTRVSLANDWKAVRETAQ